MAVRTCLASWSGWPWVVDSGHIAGFPPLPLFRFPFPALSFKMQRSLQQTLPPYGTLLGNSRPRVDVDVLFLHARLEDVLEAFFLPSPGTVTLTELGEDNLLRESVVRHPDKVAGPTKLMADNHRLNAGGICLREDTDVGTSVLPLDSEDLPHAALMVLLQRFKMSPVRCPRFSSLQKGGNHDCMGLVSGLMSRSSNTRFLRRPKAALADLRRC